jgi:hypothetical protein
LERIHHHDVAVGFYTDAKGNTDGFEGTPVVASVAQLRLQAMPQGTVTFVWTPQGQLTAEVSAFGLTPGSSHSVELVSPAGAVLASFGTLTANGVGQASATHFGSLLCAGI